MKFSYDKEVDALYIQISEAQVETSDEMEPGIILDYDADGKVVGVEVLDASKRMEEAGLETTRQAHAA